MESKTSITKMSEANKSKSRFNLISLTTAFSTALITLLQIYIIVYRFKQLAELLNTLTSSSHLSSSLTISYPPQSHLYASIIVNIFVLVLSALFTIVYAFINPFKIGVNAHDNFKLGKNIDRSVSGQNGHQYNVSFESSDQSLSSSSSIVKRRKIDCFWFKRTEFWSQLPPIGASCHLMSSLLIIISDLLFDSKRIELGQVPSGDIFLTRLDFLFGQPIERQPSLGNMFGSKDDFSGSARFGVVNLDYLNYAIAVFVYTIKLADQFWSTSKRFSLFIFIQALVVSALMVVSICGLEIIIKAVLLKGIARDLLVVNTDWHAFQVVAVFLLSLLILHINLWVLVRWGYEKYEAQKVKFQSTVQAYLLNCNKNGSFLLQHPTRLDLTVAETSTSSMGGRSSTGTANSSQESNEADKTTDKITKKFSNWKCCVGLKSLKSYSNNLISSALFLLYCLSRSVLIYDTFVCLKSTRDVVLIVSLITEMLIFLAWLLALLLITKRTKWAFDLDVTYRLVYWNRIYETWRSRYSKPSSLFVAEQVNNTTHFVINNNEDLTETSEIKDGPISTITISESENTYMNKHPVLLVRDDSLMSKSGKMSSSSITEVSSLLPSILSKQPNKYQLRVNDYTEHHSSLGLKDQNEAIKQQQQMITNSKRLLNNQTTSSTTMDKVSPSGFSSSSSSSSTAVDSGRDSFVDSSPANSALSSKYLFSLPIHQQLKLQQQLKHKQQTVILGLRNSKCLDTHC